MSAGLDIECCRANCGVAQGCGMVCWPHPCCFAVVCVHEDAWREPCGCLLPSDSRGRLRQLLDAQLANELASQVEAQTLYPDTT